MTESTQQLTGAENVAWNLADLYAAVDDPAIDRTLDEADARADHLAEQYKGHIADLDTEELRALVEEYEAIQEDAYLPGAYAYLLWSTNTEDPARGALRQKVQERSSQLDQKLVFVELEWAAVPDDKAQPMIGSSVLEPYKHWLEVVRLRRPYMLTEPEEKILSEKAVTGKQAWSRYFNEVISSSRYKWEGEPVPLEMVLNKLYETDRSIRKQAADAVTEGLEKNIRTTTYIFNTLLADKASDDRLRKFPSWISARNISNEVDDESVEALIEAVTGRYDIVARYYKLKARLLGLDELYHYDRYAPLPAADHFYTWEEASQIVLDSYEAFAPRMREITQEFLDKSWIDAPIRPGKLGGAYSAGLTPSVHPYIMLNFEGKMRNVMTLAHELGHGIHQYLSREVGMLQSHTPLTTAETASTFGEMLIFQAMMEREDDPKVRLAMLTGKIEDSFATIFRQVAMNRFEHAIHTHRREKGELSTEDISGYWLQTQRDMFIDSLNMTDDYGIWWSYVHHFTDYPGYVYAYSFGELLVMALYARYEQAPGGFADAYLEMLGRGGSDWPHAIVKPLGVDLKDPGFWNHGLQILDDMVSQAEALAEETG